MPNRMRLYSQRVRAGFTLISVRDLLDVAVEISRGIHESADSCADLLRLLDVLQFSVEICVVSSTPTPRPLIEAIDFLHWALPIAHLGQAGAERVADVVRQDILSVSD